MSKRKRHRPEASSVQPSLVVQSFEATLVTSGSHLAHAAEAKRSSAEDVGSNTEGGLIMWGGQGAVEEIWTDRSVLCLSEMKNSSPLYLRANPSPK